MKVTKTKEAKSEIEVFDGIYLAETTEYNGESFLHICKDAFPYLAMEKGPIIHSCVRKEDADLVFRAIRAVNDFYQEHYGW